MSETESSAKKEKMVYDSGRDRLSELPSSIIDIILSSVSTRDAVRMSILSRQFRYTWTSLPHLMFDLSEFSSKECIEKFIANVVKLHKGHIHKFVMSVSKKSWEIEDDWLFYLPKNEVQKLSSVVYSFQKITCLELLRCRVGPPPLTFKGFLWLKCLILTNAYISLKGVEIIVASSPLLETLKLYRCGSYDRCPELRISAPNLKYLELKAHPGDCMQVYICAPLLAEASISISFDDNYDTFFQKLICSTFNYTNFFGGCTHVRELRGNFFNKVLSFGIDSCQYSFVLPCLKVIELDGVNSLDVKEMSLVENLVAGAPNLEKLELKFNGAEAALVLPCMDISLAPNFKWEKLRIITMQYLIGFHSEIELIKLLLEKSPALEIMNLHTFELDSEEDQNLRTEVSKCICASPKITLCFP